MGISRSRHCGRGVDPILAFGRGTGAAPYRWSAWPCPRPPARCSRCRCARRPGRRDTRSGPRRAAGRRHDVPDQRGQDLPLGRRAVVRQLHLAGEADVVGQPASAWCATSTACSPSTPTATSGTVSATLTGHNRQYGRWEARVRGRAVQHGRGTPYHVVWELVPTQPATTAGRAASCWRLRARHQGARTCTSATCPSTDFTASTALPLGRRPVPHLRRRGHEGPHLVVRRHPRADDRAATGARTGRDVRRPLPARRDAGRADGPGPDADGLGPLLHRSRDPTRSRSRLRRRARAGTPGPADLRRAGGRSPAACTTRRVRRTRHPARRRARSPRWAAGPAHP